LAEARMSIDKIQEDPRLQRLFARAFKHPILGGKAQWVSLEWLLEIANPDPAAGEESDEEMWKEMEKKGLREPLIIACGSVEGRARLETGAREIRVLLAKGVLHAPAVALLAENAWVDKGNGEHEGKLLRLWASAPEAPLGIYAERVYLPPSELIPSCPAYDQKGFAEERSAPKKEVKKEVKKAPSKPAPKEEPKPRRARAEKEPSAPAPAQEEPLSFLQEAPDSEGFPEPSEMEGESGFPLGADFDFDPE
jgi:hypothetical protein